MHLQERAATAHDASSPRVTASDTMPSSPTLTPLTSPPRTNRAHGAPLQQAATTAATPAASSHDASGASNSERSLRSRVGWWKKETRWQLLAASSSAGTGPRMVDDVASARRVG